MGKINACILMLVVLSPFLYASGFWEIERIRTDYVHYWHPEWLIDPSGASQWANAFGIDETNATNEEILTHLTPEEKKAFSKSLKRFEKSDEYLEESKTLQVAFSITYFAYSVSSFSFNSPIFAAMATIRQESAISWGLASLSESSHGINEAFPVLDEEVGRLELAGAGYANYTGGAKGVYNELNGALDAIRKNEREGDGLGNRYAKSLWLSDVVSKGLLGIGALEFETPGAFPELMELLRGSDRSVFSDIVMLRRETIAALAQMDDEYGQLDRLCADKISSVNADISRMSGYGYGRIDDEIVLVFSRGDFKWESSGLSPSESLKSIISATRNMGSEKGAEQILRQAQGTVGRKERNYFARGIEQLAGCIGKVRWTETEIQRTDVFVDELIVGAKAIVDERGQTCKRAIDGFSPETDEEKALYLMAVSKYEKAGALVGSARYSDAGTFLAKHADAIELYDDTLMMLSDSSTYNENTRAKARDAIAALKGTIKDAEKDRVDASAEGDYIESVERVVDVARLEFLESIVETSDAYSSDIKRRAYLKYSGLENLRNEILDTFLDEEPLVGELDNEYGEFLAYENSFARNGTISPELALGHYRELESFYNRFTEKISQYKSLLISRDIEKHSETSVILEKLPMLDSPAPVTVEVKLYNKLGIGYSGPISAEVPLGIEVRSSDVVWASDEVDEVAYASGKLLVLLKSVGPNSYYGILFKLNRTIGDTKTTRNSNLLLGPNLLVHTVEITFSSGMETKVGSRIELPSWPSRASAEIGGLVGDVSIVSDGGKIEAIVSGEAKEGTNTLKAEFIFENPIIITKTGRENMTAGIESTVSYLVHVSCPFEVRDVPIYLNEPMLEGGKVDVRGLDGWVAKNVDVSLVGLGGQISWEIEELIPETTALFMVSFTVDDKIGFAKHLYDETLSLLGDMPYAWAADEVANADSMIKSGAYDKAIGILEETRSRLERIDSPGMDSVLGGEIGTLKREIEIANATMMKIGGSGLATDGMGEAIQTAFEMYVESQSLMDSGDYDEALLAVGEGKRIIMGIDYGNLFDRRDNVSIELGKTKRDALLLMQLMDTQESLGEIDNIEALLTDAERIMGDAEYGEAVGLLENISSMTGNVSRNLNIKAQLWYVQFEERIDEYSELAGGAYWELTVLEKAMGVSETRVSKGGAPELSINLKETRSSIEAIDRHLKNILESMHAEDDVGRFIVENAPNLRIALNELEQLIVLENAITSEIEGLDSMAERGIENARMALDQLVELKGHDAEMDGEIGTLGGYLDDAREALDDGRFADSLILSSHIQKRSLYLLKLPVDEKDNSIVMAVGVASICLLLALVALFILKGKKHQATAPGTIPRAVPKHPKQK
ncbi:MAG: hypothetical protein ABIG39_03405 [Candidatus Micrarchaeota archaeon]